MVFQCSDFSRFQDEVEELLQAEDGVKHTVTPHAGGHSPWVEVEKHVVFWLW